VIPQVRDLKRVFSNPTQKTVLAVNAPRPPSGQLVLQRFWFAYAFVRAAPNLFYELIDAAQH
jgi:hypothetical protein